MTCHENNKDFICKNFLSAEDEGVQLLFVKEVSSLSIKIYRLLLKELVPYV